MFLNLMLHRVLRSALHVWLDAFPEDFREPPDFCLLKQLAAFCEEQAKDTELHFKVKHRMERLINQPPPSKHPLFILKTLSIFISK